MLTLTVSEMVLVQLSTFNCSKNNRLGSVGGDTARIKNDRIVNFNRKNQLSPSFVTEIGSPSSIRLKISY